MTSSPPSLLRAMVGNLRGWLANRSSFIFQDGPTVAPAALWWATFACIHERRLVDQTGIEPVTS